MNREQPDTAIREREIARTHREGGDPFARWARGYGVIEHSDRTQVRVYELAELAEQRGHVESREEVFDLLFHADRLTSAALWLVVHMTYTKNVRTDGRSLNQSDFKSKPEGHTGGSLNMVPAYVGYLAANAISKITRSWLMGQGHCVAAIDATNLLAGNMLPEHAERYRFDDEGLSRFVRDFYSYQLRSDGRPESPLGSHVNPHTAGGMIEGGYLGFAELLYVHMPLPGDRLVAFLSDGAFEEQRGSDWVPRWWRAEDSGLVAPIMIANGRRIDQRTTLAQQGGLDWFHEHLEHNGFDPIDIDGRDPAAFAWAILTMEDRLTARAQAVAQGQATYPVLLPYTIAETVKGFGFPGAGTNRAHNLPLAANPAEVAEARDAFNSGAAKLFTSTPDVLAARSALSRGIGSERPPERDHALATRSVGEVNLPSPPWLEVNGGPTTASPMEAIDRFFVDIVKSNPHLRPRVGNPDELRSNRMNATLDLLKHRVTAPEPGIAEAIDGAVVTALNEEAVVCAALGNKDGLNLVATYEAFGVKMLGALRQEVIFARHQREVGRPPRWLGVPILLSSHTWENGKNEQSHQDPTMCEGMSAEMSDVSRAVFPADANSALALFELVYRSRGVIWTFVAPKGRVPNRLDAKTARKLAQDGACVLQRDAEARALLCATGAYQLTEAVRASRRLTTRGVAHSLVYLAEPGRFREPRDSDEARFCVDPSFQQEMFPPSEVIRIFFCHMRPEILLGVVRPLDTGPATTRALGYRNRGGTLDVQGMLIANRCSWAHGLWTLATAMDIPAEALLSGDERAALSGEGDPAALF